MLKNCRKNKLGFTLLELLVVVLIIGILAAIALPQYKKAVLKSKYATLKNVVKSIQESQQRFYLTNNRLGNFYELDIDVGTVITENVVYIKGATCYIEGVSDTNDPKAFCYIGEGGAIIRYQVYIFDNRRYCIVTTKKNTDFENLCKQETGKTINCNPETYPCYYRY